MPLKHPSTSSPADLAPRPDESVCLRHSFRLLTPMHGGGVTSDGADKPYDRVTPIRVASIRGQLRFWWRACGRPEPIADIADLRRQEAEVWGSTSVPSSTVLTVPRQPPAPRPRVVFKKDDRGRCTAERGMEDIAYGAFPLKPGEKSAQRPGPLHDFGTSTFTLEIRCKKEHARDIEQALQAWALFGGLGGRTRRGFGAIEYHPPARPRRDRAAPTRGDHDDRDDPPLRIPTPRAFLDDLAARHTLPGVPTLVGATVTLSPASHPDPEAAWRGALRALQSLRQRPNVGRNPGSADPKKPGRSRWPEPDAIRSLIPAPRGTTYKHKVLRNIPKFPRSAFGLPIVFHFTGVDPEPTTLYPEGHERLASPIILRPLAVGSGYRALALRLRGTGLPDRLVLESKVESLAVRARLTPAEAAQITPLGGHNDPLDAFLAHFEKSAP